MTVANEQVAGVYRRKVGDVLVTALNDGGIELPPEVLLNVTPADREAVLRAGGRRPPFISAINAYLLQWDGRAVLIDTGAGKSFGPTAGRLQTNITAAGLTPDQITDLVLTHLHGDHVGGMVNDAGAPAFPNAKLWVAETEIAYWTSSDNEQAAPEAFRTSFDTARNATTPYAGRTQRFTPGEIMPGLEAVALPGHTPGHTGYMLTSARERLLIWGDVCHVPMLQAARPDIGTIFDSNPAEAIRTRRASFDRAVSEDLLIAGMHMSFPGFARIAQAADAYVIQPEVWQATL